MKNKKGGHYEKRFARAAITLSLAATMTHKKSKLHTQNDQGRLVLAFLDRFVKILSEKEP